MKILVRGGGDLASGVIARAYRAGWEVLVTELPTPLVVRRTVSFAQVIFSGQAFVEEILGVKVEGIIDAYNALKQKKVPVTVDPQAGIRKLFLPDVIVDARMLKSPKVKKISDSFSIGLGPGFTVGENCDVVIETKRGFHLGRVLWSGSAQDDTGIPENMAGHTTDRVIRAPISGFMHELLHIGDECRTGETIAYINETPVNAPFDGLVRGLLHEGIMVHAGMKIGDVDPRKDPVYCQLISDKALAVGGGVLEAILTWAAKGKP